MSALQYLFGVGRVIAGCITIIIIAALYYKLFQSFKERNTSSKMKISIAFVFMCYIVYNLSLIIGRVLIPSNLCSVKMPIIEIGLWITKGALYNFFIVRIELVFKGSGYEKSSCLINSLRVYNIAVFGVIAPVYSCIIQQFPLYDEVNKICLLSDDAKKVGYPFAAWLLLSDLCLAFICIGLYLRPLYTLHLMNKNMQAMDRELSALEVQNNDKNDQLLVVIKKQCKLAWVAFLTTILIVYMGAVSPYLIAFGFVDSLVNVLSVYCTFEFTLNRNIYRYCCHCGGNKWILCMFCFCCCCCNDGNAMDDKKEKKATSDDSNATTAATSGNVSASSTTNNVTNNVTITPDTNQLSETELTIR